MDKIWRVTERTCIVLGLLVAVGTLYYTAAPYYGWNQPISSPKYGGDDDPLAFICFRGNRRCVAPDGVGDDHCSS